VLWQPHDLGPAGPTVRVNVHLMLPPGCLLTAGGYAVWGPCPAEPYWTIRIAPEAATDENPYYQLVSPDGHCLYPQDFDDTEGLWPRLRLGSCTGRTVRFQHGYAKDFNTRISIGSKLWVIGPGAGGDERAELTPSYLSRASALTTTFL
jgi:hypothetical protein